MGACSNLFKTLSASSMSDIIVNIPLMAVGGVITDCPCACCDSRVRFMTWRGC